MFFTELKTRVCFYHRSFDEGIFDRRHTNITRLWLVCVSIQYIRHHSNDDNYHRFVGGFALRSFRDIEWIPHLNIELVSTKDEYRAQ